MTHACRCGFGDYVFSLETDCRDLADFFRRYTARFRSDAVPAVRYRATRRPRPTLVSNGGAEVSFDKPSDLFPALESRFLSDLIELVARDRPIFHAASLARSGQADVFLGASGAGKSTLCARMVRDGYTYLSDELTIVDGSTVIALPRPICMNHATHPPELRPDGDARFEPFGYTFRDVRGAEIRALFYLPRPGYCARAGEHFKLGTVYALQRTGGGAPTQARVEGTERRARFALARYHGLRERA